MKLIISFFVAQVQRREFGVYIFKVPHGVDEWNSNWRKGIKRENPKKKFSSVKYINLNINL